MPYRSLSYWLDSVPGDLSPRDPLPGDLDVDVAIAGAGFTGLWTAYYLAGASPGLRIAVCEREIAGFGASGRNGGWCSAYFPASLAKLERMAGRDQAIAMYRAMEGTVDEVGRVVAAEGIDCHWAKGGTLQLARSPAQLERAIDDINEARSYGFGEDDLRLLTAAETAEQVSADGRGRRHVQPALRGDPPGPAGPRAGRGGAPPRGQRVRGHAGHRDRARPVADHARARSGAQYVIRATEGYTPELPGLHRAIAPVYSLMIATAPLPESVWDQIGLASRPTFGDFRHLIIYGQRTADGRLAFGGRGAPYHFGSSVRPEFDRSPAVFSALRRTLQELFPALGEVEVTHAWGGPLGVPRDWCASAGLDPATGLGWAGGYVGDGVATTNLAGRTLADLVLKNDSEITRLPWVGHRRGRWETEPLRWLGANAGLQAMSWADRAEARSGRPSRLAQLAGRFLGG